MPVLTAGICRRYNPNVLAYLQGSEEPEKIVIVGAHYDSRGVARTDSTATAPGADDDGSGISLLLQLANTISQTDVNFK